MGHPVADKLVVAMPLREILISLQNGYYLAQQGVEFTMAGIGLHTLVVALEGVCRLNPPHSGEP
jgi:hypothetical protein